MRNPYDLSIFYGLYSIVLHTGVLHSRFKVIQLCLFLRFYYLTKAEGKTISAETHSISFEGVWHKVFPILVGYQTEIVRFGDRLLTILRKYVLDPNTCWRKKLPEQHSLHLGCLFHSLNFVYNNF